jgi:uncharacterized repeat protein (TIGR03803 family)
MNLAVLASAMLLIFAAAQSQAQTYTVLHDFTGGADGEDPTAGLSMDRAGNLYGTTSAGGHGNVGTVYRLQHKNSGWVFSTLYEFSITDGAEPQARVIVGPDGNLYGTTTSGGAAGKGTVFRLQPPPTFCRAISCPWRETVLHSFAGGSDGANPTYGDLAFDQAGNIYGTTPYGGSSNCGVVYELFASGGGWTESILYTSACEYGGEPYAGVTFDNAGNLYGTISGAGVSNGAVYKLTHTGSGWVESTIYAFPFPGGAYGGLTFDAAGNLYGISFFNPTVYELSPSNGGWSYRELYAIGGYGAVAQPTMDSAGNIYGTGVFSTPQVFRLTPSDGMWTLTGFDNTPGAEPFSNVLLDASGNLYVTASAFGAHERGLVFEITP